MSNSIVKFMVDLVPRAAVIAVNYHIKTHIKPDIVRDRSHFMQFEAQTLQMFMLTNPVSPLFSAWYNSVVIISRKFKVFRLPSRWQAKLEVIGRRISFVAVLSHATEHPEPSSCGWMIEILRTDQLKIQVLLLSFWLRFWLGYWLGFWLSFLLSFWLGFWLRFWLGFWLRFWLSFLLSFLLGFWLGFWLRFWLGR